MKNCTISFLRKIHSILKFLSRFCNITLFCAPISFKSQSIALYYKKWFVELQFEKRVEIIIFILQVPLVRIADLLHAKIVVLLGMIRCPNELGFVVTSQCQLFETEKCFINSTFCQVEKMSWNFFEVWQTWQMSI